MTPRLFPTPEAAAMEGFNSEHCRVLAVELDGDDGFVMLDTGPPRSPYLYGGTVKREFGGWSGGIDSNGGGIGWTSTEPDRDVGVVHVCGEAPEGADAVRVSWRGTSRESPVRNGIVLLTWWQEKNPQRAYPRVVAYRVGDEWIEAEPC